MSVTTCWWWVRHAPVINTGGRIYGQDDPECDCSDMETFRQLAQLLPHDAVWVTSHLQRTHATAQAIMPHMPPGAAPEPLVEPAFAEQNFGDWQGLTHDEIAARRDGTWHRFWLAPAEETPPGGESFTQVVERVTEVIQRLSIDHAGRDIVAVTHGGTIRAALAVALGIAPNQALAFSIDNCALTQIDHFPGAPGSHAPEDDSAWRVRRVNLLPKALP